MKVTFVRAVGQRDRIHVHRDDGPETGWAFATYGDELPHDLVHLVVEGELGLTRGVWGRVAAGLDIARVNEDANRRGGKDKYQGMGGDLDLLLVAEACANVPWTADGEDGASLLALVRAAIASAGLDLPGALERERFSAIRDRLVELRGRWRSCVPRGSITLDFGAVALAPRGPARR